MVWQLLILAAVIGIGVVIVMWMDRWRKQPLPVKETPAEQLAHFQELLDRGELSQHEFDRIKARLNKGFLNEPQVPPQANGAPKA